jgi:hypothetical protein
VRMDGLYDRDGDLVALSDTIVFKKLKIINQFECIQLRLESRKFYNSH